MGRFPASRDQIPPSGDQGQVESVAQMLQGTVVVIAGGTALPPDAARLLAPWVAQGAPVIAADAGVDHALALGVLPAMAVGDFDSVSATGLARLEAAGIPVQRHPRDKDATDLELALAEAARVAGEIDADTLVVVGDGGGRLDHLLGMTAALAAPSLDGLQVRAHLGPADVVVVRSGAPVTLGGVTGQLVTLLPVGGAAIGVVTTGLEFGLEGHTLESWTSRGVSNRFVGSEASVTVGRGTLLAILPDAAEWRINSGDDQQGELDD